MAFSAFGPTANELSSCGVKNVQESKLCSPEASAWDVLVRLVRTARELRLSVHLALISPKVSEIVEADPEAARCRNELLGLLDEVVREAKQEGSLRPDVGAGDVTMLVALLLREMPNFAGEAASPG